MQPRYLVGGGVNANSSTALWSPVDWYRNGTYVGLAIFSSGQSYTINVTMDDPTGTYPNPVLNPGYPTLSHGSTGAAVQVFGSSQVGGYGGVASLSSTFTAPGLYCFGAGTGSAIGAITQPIAAIQLVAPSGVVLTVLQAGPR